MEQSVVHNNELRSHLWVQIVNMPQLRSFGSFAQTPNLGANYLGGANLAQRESEFQVNTQLERQKLKQQMAMAEMEAASRASALQQQALRQAQELEVEKAYRQQQIGLQERKLALEEQGLNEELQQAAATTGARMAMQRQVEELIRGGASPSQAFRRAAAVGGVAAQLPDGVLSDVMDEGKAQAQSIDPKYEIGKMYPVDGREGWSFGRTGPNSGQYFPQEKQAYVPQPVPGHPDKELFANRLLDKPAAVQANKLEKDADEIRKDLRGDKWAMHKQSLEKSKDPDKKLTLGDKQRISDYNAQLAELKKMQEDIARLRSSLTNAPAAAPQGTNSLRILNIRQK